MSFVDDCAEGRTTLDRIDDAVDDWHEGRAGEGIGLREHLGMSQVEYSTWVTRPSTLASIVEARRKSS